MFGSPFSGVPSPFTFAMPEDSDPSGAWGLENPRTFTLAVSGAYKMSFSATLMLGSAVKSGSTDPEMFVGGNPPMP